HAIGKVVLARYLPGEFSQVVGRVVDHRFTSAEAEEACIGITHAELGYLLADHWNLPLSISQAIRDHHDPARSTETPLISAVVHLADLVAIRNGLDTGDPWWDDPVLDRRAWNTLKGRKLDLDETDIEGFSSELKRCRHQIDEFLERPEGSSPHTRG
ncbi:MAG: HDOD domain-containing protein, partial [Deltaproteobacteria bacterium]|nr:HDOD domain-containing protein [Deltaproteobacteria bacterium]